MDEKLRVSWSSIQAYLSCPRKYDLSYRARLQRLPSAEHRNMILGSAFHAGIDRALREEFDASVHQISITTPWLVQAAVEEARIYIEQATVVNKRIPSEAAGGALALDFDYYQMLREVSALVVELLEYHLPKIGIGSRYLVPSIPDVLAGNAPQWLGNDPVPATEWHFEYPLDENTVLSGYIDSILWDTEEEQYVMVDWKTRGVFPYDGVALLDGQLHLYAAVVNDMAGYFNGQRPINKIVMYQFRTKTPAPASISKRTNLPNDGAKSYDTTWEVWCNTLPHGIDPTRYTYMQALMKTDADFQHPVQAAVTQFSCDAALQNVDAAVASMRAAIASGKPMAAVLSSNGCKWCDFARLCATPLRYGGELDSLIAAYYETKPEKETETDNDEV